MFSKASPDSAKPGTWPDEDISLNETADWEEEEAEWDEDQDAWDDGWYYEESSWTDSLPDLLPVMFVLVVWCVLAGIAITNHCSGGCRLF